MRIVPFVLFLGAATHAAAQAPLEPPPLPGNQRVEYPIRDSHHVDEPVGQSRIEFYFADETGPVGRELGPVSASAGSDNDYGARRGACNAAFTTALEQLAEAARAAGADAVTTISSDPAAPSASTRWSYLCDQGAVELSGVAVKWSREELQSR